MYIILLLSLLSLQFMLCRWVKCFKRLGRDRLNGVYTLRGIEHCRNPWNGKCRSTDIELYVMHKGAQLPICRRCWGRIANSNVEWGVDEVECLKSVGEGA